MSRRRYLLSLLADSEKYIENVYSYVYFSLLNDANLRDKGKAKLNTIYGNGVIENQLVNPKTDATSTEITVSYDDNTKKFHITGTPSSDVYLPLNIGFIETFANHKYFIFGLQNIGSGSTFYFYLGGNASNPDTGNGSIFTVSTASTTRQVNVYVRNGTTVDIYVKPQLIDLTLMFGTGNEPTSLSDNRIQELLNRGYIPYNTGEYKASKVGEIEFEPYNLFDGQLQLGYIGGNGTTINSSNTDILTQNFIQVRPNKTYYCNANNFSHTSGFVCEYDENQNYITNTRRHFESTHSFETSSITKYVKFWFYSGGTTYSEVPTNAQVYLSLVDLGYKPYIALTKIALPNTLELGGAINSHDTFEITQEGYVFTRNVWKYTFTGNESWTQYTTETSGVYRYACNIYNNKIIDDVRDIPNLVSKKYPTTSQFNSYRPSSTYTGNSITFGTSGSASTYVFVFDSAIQSASDMATNMANQTIYYELATPQVITIPKKHLGCIDLGSLSWYYDSESGHETMFSEVLNNIAKPSSSDVIANIYTNKYLSATWSNVYSHNGKNIIAIQGNGRIRVYAENMGTNATDFKNAMSGIYLFYETESEVADFTNKATYEKGGTITTNEYSWVENQWVKNGNFSNGTNYYQLYTSNGSYSAEDNILTFTRTIDTLNTYYFLRFSTGLSATSHKCLFLFKAKASASTRVNASSTNGNWSPYTFTTTWEQYNLFFTNGNVGDILFANITDSLVPIGGTISLKDLMVFDLTQAFGSGNEPTSVNDYRIQDIINKGYIATNTSGTEKAQSTRTLCNLKMKMQK